MSELPVWDDGAWAALPELTDDAETDVCVIGLGGSGLACVLELLALGRRVVGLDAGTVGGGAAGRNGGFLLAGLPAFYHQAAKDLGRERAHAIYRRTMVELDHMTEETPQAIRRTGSLRIADDAIELRDCDAQLQMMLADRLPVEPYDGPEGRGILVPTDAAFNPLQRCRMLARRALAGGARLCEHSAAITIGGDLVRTARHGVRCSSVIVAVDGGLERVLPELAPRVRTARLQMLATAPILNLDLPRPVYRRWGYEYWQQLPDRRIALGGLRDRSGDGEWTDVAVATDAVQRGLERVLRDQLGVTARVTHRWAGAVGYSANGLPVVDEVRPRVWAIGGYSGTGNILGALCGRGVAQLAVTGRSELLSELRHPA
ncbi:MAG TPA: FAD-dependent oxidoreductase [Gemmatimonadales bacterium]